MENSAELNFVMDLAVILISAGVITILSKAFKQPLILGYILAGFLVGPKFGLFPTISSVESVEQWSEIGMIFLMFALGLEFSFKNLIKVGSSALITAGCKFVGMFVLGLMVGSAIGWSMMECIFLGGLLSMASTAIVIKAYDEMGLKQKPYAQLVFGTLVVEDLIAIILMVLLSTMAVSHKFSGMEMLFGLMKLGFFLVLWFLVGIYVIPTLLKKAKPYVNNEILLIVSLGLCFGMVSLATYVGFSSALGAFVMGSILAETIEGEHISKLVVNIKNLFGAIFFVSVGMMIDPAIIAQYWAVILLLVIVVIVGHLIFAAGGVVLLGKGLENGIHTGMALTQLGEFAFIIVSMGVSMGVMRSFIYPVVIAVSVITTFTTPYMIKLADPLYQYLNRKLPEKVLSKLNPRVEETIVTNAEGVAWKAFLRAYFLRIMLYGVLVIAVFNLSEDVYKPFLEKILSGWEYRWINITYMITTIIVMLPFLFGMTANAGSIGKSAKILLKKKNNAWHILALMLIRIFVAMGFIIMVIVSNADLSYWTILLVIVSGLAFFYAARGSMYRFARIERRFLSNLNEKEEELKRLAPVRTTVKDKLAGYDVHIEEVQISPNSKYVGMMLKETPFRSKSGVNIVKIIRGKRNIIVPQGFEHFYPYDRVLAVGTTAQLRIFKQMMQEDVEDTSAYNPRFDVETITVEEGSILDGVTLKEVDMRAHGCMVLSVLRGDDFQANPHSDFRFRPGDTVWIAGEKGSAAWML